MADSKTSGGNSNRYQGDAKVVPLSHTKKKWICIKFRTMLLSLYVRIWSNNLLRRTYSLTLIHTTTTFVKKITRRETIAMKIGRRNIFAPNGTLAKFLAIAAARFMMLNTMMEELGQKSPRIWSGYEMEMLKLLAFMRAMRSRANVWIVASIQRVQGTFWSPMTGQKVFRTPCWEK